MLIEINNFSDNCSSTLIEMDTDSFHRNRIRN